MIRSDVEYHRVLAGEKRRIGRGILAIALLLIGVLAVPAAVVIGAGILESQRGVTTPAVGGTDYTVLYHASGMAAIALVTPWSMLIQRWLYGVPGPSLHSVVSRFRFDAFGRAVLYIGPLWVLAVVAQYLLIGPGAVVEMSFLTAVGLLGANLLLAPLQAAGEEYGLRGLVFRVVGGWSRGPRAGLVLGVVVSSVLFAVIHGSVDPVLNGYYLVFAVVAAIVTWRTGGIEIAVVVHALTNVLAFSFGIVVREDLAGSLGTRTATLADVGPLVVALVVVLVVVLVLTRRGALRTTGVAGAPVRDQVPSR